MHGLQEIIYANEQAHRKAQAQSLKWRNAAAHNKIETLSRLRSGATKKPSNK